MLAYVVSEGRLFALNPSDWAKLLVGVALSGFVCNAAFLIANVGTADERGRYVEIHQRRYSRRRVCRGADVAMGHEHAARCRAGARCSTAINACHSNCTSGHRARNIS